VYDVMICYGFFLNIDVYLLVVCLLVGGCLVLINFLFYYVGGVFYVICVG